MEKIIIKKCPHCEHIVMLPLLELNCKIYRHGVYKQTLLQIDPHMNRVDCDRLFREGLIYGCGKPFKIIMEEDKYKIEKCKYL